MKTATMSVVCITIRVVIVRLLLVASVVTHIVLGESYVTKEYARVKRETANITTTMKIHVRTLLRVPPVNTI